jgi:hypothetical protein
VLIQFYRHLYRQKTTAFAGAGDGLSLRGDYSISSIVNEQRQTKLHFTLPRYSPVDSRWLSITSPAATHLPYLVDIVGLTDSLCEFGEACLVLAATPFQSYPSCARHALGHVNRAKDSACILARMRQQSVQSRRVQIAPSGTPGPTRR